MSISQLPEAVHWQALLLGFRRQSLEHQEKKALGELLGSTGVLGILPTFTLSLQQTRPGTQDYGGDRNGWESLEAPAGAASGDTAQAPMTFPSLLMQIGVLETIQEYHRLSVGSQDRWYPQPSFGLPTHLDSSPCFIHLVLTTPDSSVGSVGLGTTVAVPASSARRPPGQLPDQSALGGARTHACGATLVSPTRLHPEKADCRDIQRHFSQRQRNEWRQAGKETISVFKKCLRKPVRCSVVRIVHFQKEKAPEQTMTEIHKSCFTRGKPVDMAKIQTMDYWSHMLTRRKTYCKSEASALGSQAAELGGPFLNRAFCREEKGQGVKQQMHFSAQILYQFESKLNEVIQLYQQRIQWLKKHSRKAFGLIKGKRVGILIDQSVVSSSPQKEVFLGDLESLLEEQLSKKEKLYVLSFGSSTSDLWPGPVDVSASTLQEVKLWLRKLKPDRGSNLLQALRKIFTLKELDSLVTIMGSCPDQSSEILSDYIQQSVLGGSIMIHIVTYKCDNQVPPAVLKNLAEGLGACYHCYNREQEINANQDVESLLEEIQAAQSLMDHIQSLHHSSPSEELTNMIKERAGQNTAGPLLNSTTKPPKHEDPLTIAFPNLEKNSAEWLKTYGLKAKKLSLYQVLAPNAFSPVEEFVPILKKTVSSTIHEKAMVQFEWHDGTMKNVHVDVPFLYEYQKQLNRIMRVYERRIEWLSLASRRIWGTVCEKRVVILLDVSETNSMYIIHIQHALRLLLEEQLANKDALNVIAFGSTIESWMPEMVAVNHNNLQSVWRWALGLQCQGSRNVLGALRKAVEVDLRDKDKYESQGIYLFTGGIPDQDMTMISTYMAETCSGCNLQLNVCLFYTGEPQMGTTPPACYASRQDTATAYREVIQAVGGRFHWFGDTGIYESDDIKAITSEMEKALNYSQKCALLVASLKNQSGKESESSGPHKEKPKMLRSRNHPRKACAPKPSVPSGARMNTQDSPDRKKSAPWKTQIWHPLSKATHWPSCSPVAAQSGKERSAEQRKSQLRNAETSLLMFYTELGNSVGSVYKKYSLGKNRRRARTSSSMDLPKNDTACSSREWLANYGLKKLKMEISRHIGPKCTHQNTIQSSASTKHCSILPSIKINGTVKHLRCTPREMDIYISCLEKLMRRYVQRLQWLLSGSRQLFGAILESKVCILLDTSGSMGPYLQQVKAQLILLIWEQLRKHCDSFNLLSFADDLQLWRDTLVKTTEAACHEAMQWVTHLSAEGSTSVLEALLATFNFQDVEGLYLLTDGKPDTSCSLVLRTVQRLKEEKDVKVHTISLSCSAREEMKFLRCLASLTGGRYHCPANEKSLSRIHGLLTKGFIEEGDPTLPQFEGDDLRILAQEITKARDFLRQAQCLRSQFQKKNLEEPKVTVT
ncbi:von Willebrand factor A domain-containing protein 3A [Suncus etruscus]|uniref:von Willebrand factor A domain-containing protein 3A n=1 Tax=Suncus etruscus TaxID=109475 RepID=UPI0021107C56|nr:von Willebrand factor A domain-containing protein 3A [Suncus etruscus]